MRLTSPYSDEALEHLAQPDPLDDLIRASPPRERLAARATALSVAAFLVAVLFAPIKYSTAIPVVVAVGDEGQAIADAGRVVLRVDAAALDDASRSAVAVLSPGAAVSLIGDAGVASGRLLEVSGASANGVAIDVRLSPPAGVGAAPAGRAVLRIPAGRRSVASMLSALASPAAFE